jgi:hypothetical protein
MCEATSVRAALLFLVVAILVCGIGVVVLMVRFRDGGRVGGHPDMHRRDGRHRRGGGTEE